MSNEKHNAAPTANAPSSNFLRAIVEKDLASGAHTRAGLPEVITRFPPEPNGYLHIGHAKSICVNFGLARDYDGRCHLRFDDTNPEKEDTEYVDTIIDSVRWLGFDWKRPEQEHLYYASDYFDRLYSMAEYLITAGHAYVDSQSAEDMAKNRGNFGTPGTNSPFRNRPPEESLALFRDMKAGKYKDGEHIVRVKISEDAMASPNMTMRDPAIYRIRHAHHHRTGDAWCIYPMYAFAHPIEDALENISHSLCTLEFEDQRPWYDWLLAQLVQGGLLQRPAPKQHEFGRLNLTYVVTSKRKLKALVDEGHVTGWDDPSMPTLAGLRRRGYTASAVRKFAEDTGASKTNIWVDYSVLEGVLRADLEGLAPRMMAVIDPVPLKLSNWAELFGADHIEPCTAPAHPQHPELGPRQFGLGPVVWIERDDFAELPAKGFFRLYPPRSDAAGVSTPGNKVRLKYGMVVECHGCEKDADGRITAVLAAVVPDTKSGTPGADAVKVKGVITWVGQHDGVAATLNLYDRLFTEAQPDAGDRDFRSVLNPASKSVVQGFVEPALATVAPDQRFQFERHGYFVSDRLDHAPGAPVFNRITGLRDSWGK